MSKDREYRFEKFEEYFGDVKQVKKVTDECKICGSKLVQTYLSDYKNLIVHETARCADCGGGDRRLIHILN